MPDLEERTVSRLTIQIARGTCIGSKNCIRVAPEIFELGADQIATFRDDADDIEQDRLTEACAVCPVDALRVISEEGEQIVPR